MRGALGMFRGTFLVYSERQKAKRAPLHAERPLVKPASARSKISRLDQSGVPDSHFSRYCFEAEGKHSVPDSTSVPSNLALRYRCCCALWNTKLPLVGSSLCSRMAKALRKYWAVFR